MPVRSRRPIRRGGGRTPRKLIWATNSGVGITLTPGTIFNTDLLPGLRVAGSSVLGVTVMRTHARFSIEWETTAESGQQLTIGFVTADMDFIAPTPRVSTGERGRDWALLDGLMPGSGMNTFTFGAAATPAEGF